MRARIAENCRERARQDEGERIGMSVGMSGVKAGLARVQDFVKRNGCDALVLTSKDANCAYAGVRASEGVLVLGKRPILFVSPLEKPKDARFVYRSLKDLDQDLPRLLQGKVVGINDESMPVSLYKKIRRAGRTKDVSAGLEVLRSIKSRKEQAAIRKACRITCAIINNAIAGLKAGHFRTEGDVRRFLKGCSVAEGCALAFEPIVASGRAGATPHYFGDKRMSSGFLIIDFGVRVDGYCADVTRTVYLGRPGGRERQAYAAVLGAHDAAITFIKERCNGPGNGSAGRVTGNDVFAVAWNALGEDAKFFTHGLGHGIGLRIHERPNLKKDSKDLLKEGMAFTIEPGIYPGRFGVRIEDDLLLDGGVRVLTNPAPRQLICIT